MAVERILETTEYLDTVCGLLRQGRTCVPVPVSGGSMTPFLRPGDTVYLDPAELPLRKGDVVLFTGADGCYVLHRIARADRDGSFLLLGDAQTQPERVESARLIHGRMVRARRGEQLLMPGSLRWWFFATVWLWVIPLRRRIMTVWEDIRKKTR